MHMITILDTIERSKCSSSNNVYIYYSYIWPKVMLAHHSCRQLAACCSLSNTAVRAMHFTLINTLLILHVYIAAPCMRTGWFSLYTYQLSIVGNLADVLVRCART